MAQLSDDFLDGLISRITAEQADIFGGFYTPFLREGAHRIKDWQGEDGAARTADLPSVATTLLRSVMDSCAHIGVRTLISVFHAERETAEAPRSYEAFHQWVSTPHGRDVLLERYPELDRLLRITVTRTVDAALETLRAARDDRAALADVLGARGKVTGLTPGLGDPHRGGRTVCQVLWENGALTVYKPQRDHCHLLVDAVRSVVDSDGTFFGPLVPASVVRPAHVWQQYVRHTGLAAPEDGADYFRRFGRVAALMSLIGAGDLHHENIIATPDGPVIIDTETLVSLPVHRGADRSAQAPLSRDIEQSVLNTLLFPARYAGAKLDVDLSGIGAVRSDASEHLESFSVVDAGTDRIRFARSAVTVEHGSNMATVHGEPLDPRAWTDTLTEGFAEARRRLSARRPEVEAALRTTADWAVRHVVRPTYLYARFLEASTHPAYLGSAEERAALLDRLPLHYRGVAADSVTDLHHDEVCALLDLDVPFYRVACDAHHMEGHTGGPFRTEAGISPRQAALESVEAFFARPPARDPAYIRYALASGVDDVWDDRPSRGTGAGAPSVELLDPRPWYATLRDLVVGRETHPTLLLPQLQGTGLRLGAVNPLLYDGGGLLLCAAQTQALTGQAPLGVDAGRLLEEALRPELSAARGQGEASPFTSGALSGLVVQWEIQRRLAAPGTPAPLFPSVPARPAGDGPKVSELTAEDFDFLNGYGGLLVHLAEYGPYGAPDPLGAAAEELLEQLVVVDGAPETHSGELGLAHGRFGRLTALAALVRTGRDHSGRATEHLERFTDAYLTHRWQDDGLRDAPTAAGWCKGYAGVAYALTKVRGALGHPVEEIRAGLAPEVARLVHDDHTADLSLCHGVAGRIAVLCWLSDRLDWPDLRLRAGALRARFAGRYAVGGWTCGIGSSGELPSFFLGLSGWYYAQLMLDHPGVELPQCLGGR